MTLSMQGNLLRSPVLYYPQHSNPSGCLNGTVPWLTTNPVIRVSWTARHTVDECTSINCAILDLGTRCTQCIITICSLREAGICWYMKNDFRAGDESEDAKSCYGCGFLKRQTVEHAGMPDSTYKQKILRVFFQNVATNLQLAVKVPAEHAPDGSRTDYT